MAKRTIATILAVLLSMVLLVGCAKNPAAPDGSGNNASEYSGKKVTIKMVRIGNEQDATKDRLLLALQEKVNVTLDIISIPFDQGDDKVNIMMSSGDKIDLLNYDPGKTLTDWAKNGLVYSYDELIGDSKDYPLISAVVNSDIYKDLKINGKSYIKPFALATAHFGFMIRTDWLKNVGLEMPKNLDEFYTVIKAFKEKDPDGNGQDDTYGLFLRAGGDYVNVPSSSVFGYINNAFAINAGTGKFVELDDGSLIRWEASQNAKDGAQYINKLINEDLVNSDFLSLQRDNTEGLDSDDFAMGKYGIANGSVPSMFYDKLMAQTPEATVAQLTPIEGVNGIPANSGCGNGYWRGSILPKTGDNPLRVLDMLEYTLTKEGRILTMYGIEGIHYTKVEEKEGTLVFTLNKEECAKDWNVDANGYVYPLSWDGFNFWEHAYLPIAEYNYNYDEAFKNIIWLRESEAFGNPLLDNWVKTSSSYSIATPLQNSLDEKLIGDTDKLQSIFIEGWVKAVTATPDQFEGIWEATKAEWLSNGGQDIIDYANTIYKK